MVDITLFEIHLPEGGIDATANAPFVGRSGRGSEESDREEAGPALSPLVLGGGLAVAVVLAWRLLSGSEPTEGVEVEI
ncbi:hypothetical protein VB773_07180 [Haloarculaceae archaeon H-GB2-1]|nr:hypothetical protein [Haloarculaceae archaeon H-GB1-1]MEA5385866.1 hypothetical protein [Haloarculaceae archaeon H-GB11]MEA5407370.1 hypothetical protein [Haloarculaceae archaeon H-GB2-1]